MLRRGRAEMKVEKQTQFDKPNEGGSEIVRCAGTWRPAFRLRVFCVYDMDPRTLELVVVATAGFTTAPVAHLRLEPKRA
eukprot:3036165-Pyramimonas_sp.AAC.1